MSYGGRRADFVYIDEMKSHTADAFAYATTAAKGWPASMPVPPPREPITPLDIHCKACGAEPGARCTKTHRRYGKLRYRGYHFRRKDDARLATEAVRALNPA